MAKDYKKEAKKRAWMSVGGGVALIAAGVIATMVSYNNAGPGESYTIWWGPAAVGVVLALQGAWGFIRLPQQAQRLEDIDKAAQENARNSQ